jgi:hypothetical protein
MSDQPATTPPPTVRDTDDSGTYRARNGQISFLYRTTDDDGETHVIAKTVADFTAEITEEITAENGDKTYRIEGHGKRGGPFSLEIGAEDFAEQRRLNAALGQAVGCKDPIRAGMLKHIGPAIQLMTLDDVHQTSRFNRTGWNCTSFLIPGREPPNTSILLPRKLPYQCYQNTDLDTGLDVLESLINSTDPEKSTPILTFAFQAPFSHLAGWRNERYALFITGRTGSLKTSFAQCIMSLYGNFMDDGLLIKWGEGATRNAIMALATHAYDLPLLFDNFKPSTGGGARDFVNLVHNILEGGEKDRLNRAAKLKDTKPVYCWPLITGEDVPDKDPATLARVLVIEFEWQRGTPNLELTKVQQQAEHLTAVGDAWLSWLESDDGQDIAGKQAYLFPDRRTEWASYLRKHYPDMVNILRVASNLATNELTWDAMLKHPTVSPVLEPFKSQYRDGLLTIARTMGERTHESLEATTFLDAIRQLVANGLATLPKAQAPLGNPNLVIGWSEKDESIYLLVDIARRKAEDLVGQAALGYLTKRALYTQLDALGMIASRGKKTITQLVSIDGKKYRVLHLKKKAIQENDASGI